MTERERSEHEFEDANGQRYKVKHVNILGFPSERVVYSDWAILTLSAAGNWMFKNPALAPFAAEIARLKGLVPPGGEG